MMVLHFIDKVCINLKNEFGQDQCHGSNFTHVPGRRHLSRVICILSSEHQWSSMFVAGKLKIAFAILILSFLALACGSRDPTPGSFQLFDPNLRVELIAQQPEMVTPLGIALDTNDVLYVLESHTHSPPSDYEGPKSDRIKKGIDQDSDGIPDLWVIYADAIINGINLAIDPHNEVFVTEKSQLLSFKDTNGDHVSDVRDTLVIMELPDNVYDHAGLLGIALSHDDWIYVSRGNLSSKSWKLTGKDGSILEGYGIGGIVFRCRKDGSKLELIASGFWNPFELRFTKNGRLFATDNDPDSRGPNRLLEIVKGGDYGFKCLYGGSGLHPFVSWTGELPGSLPLAAPLGEAPCALLDANFTNFGIKYTDNLLVNVWEEKNIVRIPLEQRGSSVYGEPQILIQGDTSFHPVGMVADRKGNLYISDWVLRKYPNHSRGRIWRVSAKNPSSPVAYSSNNHQYYNRLLQERGTTALLLERLQKGDVFEQAILRDELYLPPHLDAVAALVSHSEASMRIEALLIYLKAERPLAKLLVAKLLRDPDPQVRKMALIYAGQKMRMDLREDIEAILQEGYIDRELFEIYLATVQHLQPEFIDNYRRRTGLSVDKFKQKLPAGFIQSILQNDRVDELIRSLAVPYLESDSVHRDFLFELLKSAKEDAFKIQLIYALKSPASNQVAQLFLSIAKDKNQSAVVRGQVLSALFFQPFPDCQELTDLLSESDPELVQYALVKLMKKCQINERGEAEIKLHLDKLGKENLLSVWQHSRSSDLSDDEWVNAVDGNGNVERGKLVFEQAHAQCMNCHRVNGWGGVIGPDLSNVGKSKSTKQLIDAILNPSLEIAPEWQGWYVIDSDGKRHIGRQIDVHLDRVELMNESGGFNIHHQPQQFGVMTNSIMPEGLENNLTLGEFNDLMAYLESLK